MASGKMTLGATVIGGLCLGLASFALDRTFNIQNRVVSGFSTWRAPPLLTVPAGADGDAQLPNAKLTPAQVVSIQVAALHDTNVDHGVRQCFVFASPGNQMMNGPLPRFAQMVAQPPYDVFRDPDVRWQVGTPVIDGDEATVLVSAQAGIDTVPHLFLFELSRQKLGTLRDCWMTDAAFETTPADWSALHD
ncbi:MAG: hypothetical protein KDB23_16000 [Planctomycetales bacterium]|nr:hypothetical protein [Planctomycetales bacterium]